MNYYSALCRILIVDWDVNFGHGTSKLFENDPNVMFISLHHFLNDFESGPGNVANGYNVNISWKRSEASITDTHYVFSFLNVNWLHKLFTGMSLLSSMYIF